MKIKNYRLASTKMKSSMYSQVYMSKANINLKFAYD